MAGPASETVTPPFTGFNFAVEIAVPGVSQRICHAAFSDCDGLEMTMEVKTLREGGNNGRKIRLAGPMSFGLVTLKRGMTRSFDLWNWMARAVAEPGLRGRVRDAGFIPGGGSSADAAALLRRDAQRYAELIRRANIRFD